MKPGEKSDCDDVTIQTLLGTVPNHLLRNRDDQESSSHQKRFFREGDLKPNLRTREILSHLPKGRSTPQSNNPWHRKILVRLREDSQLLRSTVQLSFALLCIWIGIEFYLFGILVAGVFTGITGLAMLTGHWQNRIPQAEYQKRFHNIRSSVYQHNRGSVPEYGQDD